MMADTRRHELESGLLAALRQDMGSPAQWLMAPGVQEGLQQLFLALADAILQPLLGALAQWQEDASALPSPDVLSGLQQLVGLAQDRRLASIEQLALAMQRAIDTARQAAPAAPTPADCQQGAEELARLLFLYAAGQERQASPDVLARLQA
jgi:hypothetical protein